MAERARRWPWGTVEVDDDGLIVDAKFKTFGCGSAIAASSLATEWIKGRNVDEAAELKNTDIASELSLPPVKIHCSVLAEDAIKAAISAPDHRVIPLPNLIGFGNVPFATLRQIVEVLQLSCAATARTSWSSLDVVLVTSRSCRIAPVRH